MELVVLTEKGAGLGEKALELGIRIWDPAKEGLREAVESLLPLYDQVLLLLAKPPFGGHLALGEALAQTFPRRLHLHPTPLFGPGLAALAERAAEMAGRLEPLEVMAELRRIEREGKLYLASGEPERLRTLGWLPPGGGLVLDLGFWALFALEGDAFRLPPLPVPKGQVPGAMVRFWSGSFGSRKVRARVALGEGVSAWKMTLAELLRERLHLERAIFSPLCPELSVRLGPKNLVAFAHPL